METPHTKSRLQVVQKMVVEMAQGNFHTRIPLIAPNDELKAVEVLVNMLAEELHSSVSLAATRRGNAIYSFPKQSTLILDDTLLIVDCTQELQVAVEELIGTLLGQELTIFLLPESAAKITQAVQAAHAIPQLLSLEFNIKGDLVVTVPCSLSRLKVLPYYVLNFEAPAAATDLVSVTDTQVVPFSAAYYRLLDDVQEYVLSHLYEPLPTLPALAALFATNQHKLKVGFKHCFGTGVYQFYHEERLKRSYEMVQLTVLPLQTIAERNGFKTYRNFCRAFKNRFGTSASEVRRQDPLNVLSSKI